MEAMELRAHVLPDAPSLQLDSWSVDDAATLMTLHVTSTQTAVPCPVCALPAQRIHSHSTRMLGDLPWGSSRVRVRLRVRKLFCTNTACPRRIFTEGLPRGVAPWARRTQRLAHCLAHIALALGGTAGARPGTAAPAASADAAGCGG